MSTRDDLCRFGFSALPTEARLKTAFHEIAMQFHPDQGGSADIFDVYRQAYDRLLKKIRKPKPCPSCKGKGSYEELDGFMPVTKACADCEGRGSRIVDQRVEDLCDELDRLLGDNEAAAPTLKLVKDRLRTLQ